MMGGLMPISLAEARDLEDAAMADGKVATAALRPSTGRNRADTRMALSPTLGQGSSFFPFPFRFLAAFQPPGSLGSCRQAIASNMARLRSSRP